MTRRRGIGRTSTEKLKAETRSATVREITEALNPYFSRNVLAGGPLVITLPMELRHKDPESAFWALLSKKEG